LNQIITASIAVLALNLNVTAQDATPVKKPLATESLALKSLAADVKKGSIKKGETLDTAFAQTHNVLALYFQGRAERSLGGKAKDQASSALSATANHIEGAAKWSGQTLTDAGKETVGLLRKTSGTLVGGAGTVVETSGDILKKGLGLITKLGSGIKGEDKDGGNVAEKGADVVKGGGNVIKKIGDKIKGETKDQ
jgi:hypothetical protein